MIDERLHIEELLEREGRYVGTAAGMSMWPMLRDRRDIIVVEPLVHEPARYEVVLYRRGASYVLHRVLGRTGDSSYLVCGDNCLRSEKVPREQMIGVLVAYRRKGCDVDMQGFSYGVYVRLWCAIRPLRVFLMQLRSLAGRTWHRVVPDV